MIEFERTFLAKFLPQGLESCPKKEIIDVYFPIGSSHCKLRIRKRGDKFYITKKDDVSGFEDDASRHTEVTIPLTREEFDALSSIEGRKLRKIRYEYEFGGRVAEIDVFLDGLAGLVLVDFEFGSAEEMSAFEMPEFCLVEVTQEEFVAGGTLCGKRYEDIEEKLKKLGYGKIFK